MEITNEFCTPEEREEHGSKDGAAHCGHKPHCGRPGRKHDHFPHYSELPVSEKLLVMMTKLTRLSRAAFDGKSSQKRMIHLLHKKGGMTQRELTERMDIRPGSASEVIKKLENAQLITRAVSEADRRTVDICLTPAGIAQAEEDETQRKARMEELFRVLSPEEKDMMLSMLERLGADWDVRYRGEERRKSEEEQQDCNRHGHCREEGGREA